METSHIQKRGRMEAERRQIAAYRIDNGVCPREIAESSGGGKGAGSGGNGGSSKSTEGRREKRQRPCDVPIPEDADRAAVKAKSDGGSRAETPY